MSPPDRIKIPETFWRALESLSIQQSAILPIAKLPPSIFQSNTHMTTAQLFDTWAALQELGGSDIGLKLTKTMYSSTLPPSFLVAFHAKNMGEALQRIARYKALCAPEVFQIKLEHNECTVSTSWIYAKNQVPDALIDATFTFLVNIARTGTGKKIVPKRVELRRSHSKNLQQWFSCPITWHTLQPYLIFDQKDLKVPFTSYNRELLEMLDTALDASLNKFENNNSVTEQVRWHLRSALTAGRPELRSIARDMALSERSLQRRLQAEGYNFQTLLSDLRHELACEYLAEANLEISEIAYLLGYQDQRSFYRAFQEWENQPPNKWRSAFLNVT